MEPILLDGVWQQAAASGSFCAHNPATGEALPGDYPVSTWADCDRALEAASAAFESLRQIDTEAISAFLEGFAAELEANAAGLVEIAHRETALPVKPRLADVELPRTTTQLRQAAQAARDGSWHGAVVDTKLNIRSYFVGMGPVVVFGPNNFPFAFNGVSGGDMAAAVAAGCPVIAKAHPLHPGTSRLLAQCASRALATSGLPATTVQMLYHLEPAEGLRLVADPRVGATAFTGSRHGGLALKKAADAAGKPIYLEMSSLNPIVLLPGALAERGEALVTEIADSGLAGAGQFCTSPNLLFLMKGPHSAAFIDGLTQAYAGRAASPLLSAGGRDSLHRAVHELVDAGAAVLTGGQHQEQTAGACYRNTVLQVSGAQFLAGGEALQKEAFGNAITLVLCMDSEELQRALASIEGNLTAAIYSAKDEVVNQDSPHDGIEQALYSAVEALLRPRCGRLLNDKMPTGVALSPAMNHGGPYPSTGHAGFTSVGIPRSLQRFGSLQCYDNVRPERLPAALRDTAPHERMWRMVDGSWVCA